MGLATLSAAVQRSGGSQQHPGEALDEKLEELGAGIEGGAGAEAFGFGFQCLREDAAEVMSLFAEVRAGPEGVARGRWLRRSLRRALLPLLAWGSAALDRCWPCVALLLVQVVRSPAIPQDKLDLAKTQASR